jgi:hypothetical protein
MTDNPSWTGAMLSRTMPTTSCKVRAMSLSRVRTGLAPLVLLLILSGCESLPELSQVLNVPTAEDVLSSRTIAAGLREALKVGSDRAVQSLGRPDGFLRSPFHIPLPESLRQAQGVAQRFGLSAVFDEMEVKLNRAAEVAAPKAGALFLSAIRQLTFEDVLAIYSGGDDAATAYLKRTTSAQLRTEMHPIVDASLAQVGAVTTFKELAGQYNRLPLVAPIDADLTGHVLSYASNALFARLASEEAAIRKNPAKRTTQLLRQVFG